MSSEGEESVSNDAEIPTPTKAAPLTSGEKALLFELIRKKSSIIESKHTDFGTTDRKKKAWEEIELTFCSSPGFQKRTVEQLKRIWTNSKRIGKKDVARFRRESLKTGGGEQPKKLNPDTEIICSMIPSQMKPLENDYDCDSVLIPPADQIIHTDLEDTSVTLVYVNHIPVTSNKSAPVTEDENLEKCSESKRRKKDPRSSLVDMEYEEHRIRLKTLALKHSRVEQQLKNDKEEHELKMKILETELISKDL